MDACSQECGEEHWRMHQHVCPRLQRGGLVSLPASALQNFTCSIRIDMDKHARTQDLGQLLSALPATFHVTLRISISEISLRW